MKRAVTIPASDDREGILAMQVSVEWKCPQCGRPRGEPHPAISYDGSRRLYCDGWTNPCGHVDKYSDVRAEAVSGS